MTCPFYARPSEKPDDAIEEEGGNSATRKELLRHMQEVLRIKQVIRITKLSRTSIWRKERAGDFPRRLRLGPNAVGWIADEIYAWVASRPRVSDCERAKRVAYDDGQGL